MLNRYSEIVIRSRFVYCELWTCSKNSTLGSVVPLAMLIIILMNLVMIPDQGCSMLTQDVVSANTLPTVCRIYILIIFIIFIIMIYLSFLYHSSPLSFFSKHMDVIISTMYISLRIFFQAIYRLKMKELLNLLRCIEYEELFGVCLVDDLTHYWQTWLWREL